MPPYGTIPADRRDTRDQDFWQNLIEQYFKKTEDRQKANYENKILQAVLSGGNIANASMQEKPSGLAGLLNRANPKGTYQGGMGDLSPLTQQVLASVMGPKLMDPAERTILDERAKQSGQATERGAAGLEREPLVTRGMEQGIEAGEYALKREPLITRGMEQKIETGEWGVKGLPLEHRGKEIGVQRAEHGLGDLPLDRRAKEIGVARSEAELAREPLNTRRIEASLGITEEQLKQMPTQTQRLLNNLAIEQENLKQTEAETGRGDLRTKRLETDIDYTQALAESWKPGGPRDKGQKNLTGADQNRYNEQMNAAIKAVEDVSRGGHDYTQENLLKAWQNFKSTAIPSYETLSPADQKKVRTQWNLKIGAKNKASSSWGKGQEYDWDPALIEKETGGSGELIKGDVRYETAPVMGLDDIWNKFDEANKQIVWKAWMEAHASGVTPEEFAEKIRSQLWGG